jgi:hypothetical protein
MKKALTLSLLLLLLAPLSAFCQRATVASEKDYQSGEQVKFLLLQVDEAGIERVLAAMKGRDGDFENLRETTHWESFKLPNLVGAIEIKLTQGVWVTKKGQGNFTPLPKLRPLKEGEQYAFKIMAKDNQGEDILSTQEKLDALIEYLEGIAKG